MLLLSDSSRAELRLQPYNVCIISLTKSVGTYYEIDVDVMHSSVTSVDSDGKSVTASNGLNTDS